MSNLTDSDQAQERILEIEKKLALFSELLILPGIEFESKPGIHILVIFNPDNGIEIIEDFLIRGGYDSSQWGVEYPTVLSRWDVLELFQQTSKLDCLVIDAHTDSSKGIWNSEPGQYRAECLKSPHLHGIGYKNEKQKDQIISLLNNDKQYLRTSPLAYIKASDSHIKNEVGKYCTWIRLEKVTFEHLSNAFTNPTESVFTEIPALTEILDELISRHDSFCVKTLESSDIDNLKKIVCALNNENGGYCLVGVSERGNRLGLPLDNSTQNTLHNSLDNILRKIHKALNEVTPTIKPKINIYPIQNSKTIVSIYIRRSDELCCIRNENLIYYVKNNKIIVLESREIQKLIEDRNTKILENKVERKLESIKKECDVLLTTFRSIPIINHFNENSIKLSKLLKKAVVGNSIKVNEAEQSKLDQLYKKSVNGKSRGTIFIINEPYTARYPEAYLRYSLPIYYYTTKHLKSKKEETIYLVPKGGVFFLNRRIPVYSNDNLFALMISSYDVSKYSNKFLCSFLKSSFNLWYSYIKHENADLTKPNIFNKIRIPIIDLKNPSVKKMIVKIEDLHDKILLVEKKYLLKKYDKNNAEKEGKNHNIKISQLATEIDKEIYKLLYLNNHQIDIIEQYLKACGIYYGKDSL